MAKALDIGVTAWSPLGGGLLTGKYNKKRKDEGGREGKEENRYRIMAVK
jgi:aryl-alcohol dehydrogenase-like predicted oxidoreductase